jgi:hypothetical protein
MKPAFFEIGIVQSFSIGFTIFSPTLNGLSIEVSIACFVFRFRSRGVELFKFNNYWAHYNRLAKARGERDE